MTRTLILTVSVRQQKYVDLLRNPYVKLVTLQGLSGHTAAFAEAKVTSNKSEDVGPNASQIHPQLDTAPISPTKALRLELYSDLMFPLRTNQVGDLQKCNI